MTKKTIFPVSRVHEPLRADVEIENGQVVDATVGATLFRGFENIMIGRDPRDAALLTQRICGICSSAHAIAAALALQEAFHVEPTPNGQHLMNLIFAADIIQNHLRHFYILAIYDYVKGPNMPPYAPRPEGDYRLPQKRNEELLAHSKEGMLKAMRAHEMLAIFGAKIPMQQTILVTGVTERATVDRISAYRSILHELIEWVEQVYLYDVAVVADYYKDYYSIGSTTGNMMSYGMFPQPITGKREYAPGIIVAKGKTEPFDVAKISEDIKYSWYQTDIIPRNPQEGTTTPHRDKKDAYSWIKAPRYAGKAFEGGPLARSWISGEYQRGTGVMDRIITRAQETLSICKLADGWLSQLSLDGPTFSNYTPPMQGEGIGLTDAMRGGLGHWLNIKDGKIVHYQIVTPTTWTFSPRDEQGQRGPVEEALLGTAVENTEDLIEVGRIIRSFDPCFTCAVHMIDAPAGTPSMII
ncbi:MULTISPECIES: nickel-dependent hydrogenase large subunit [Pelosinus]|jgi:hydrogenase large subunit|uniref:Nickel-dependent hydrogenase large subunit n=1 Tax=Pelosinus fermentans B4 TaxID=1149862 RepID=I8RJ57_9FIRM|nr:MULTISPECIES: nickel-dependent hydrogenase large subunit [Pelosinus]MDF2572044.1 Cytochrome-c3 hydrogenase [Sporomusa sp.]EIW19998.1 nickel-dependent hydrogenase large subunit [Pelosinus fermentans B4]EIW21521.1 nickel-dependent hydrogenase large subunit [Pelosinus fermentans A11]OAM95078.1 Cytochrome-c3 hydrogenase [Pelosinus fermentans DSM 17108]SDR22973.1 hydrogenase large subunit [Pelosinus fermentans]